MGNYNFKLKSKPWCTMIKRWCHTVNLTASDKTMSHGKPCCTDNKARLSHSKSHYTLIQPWCHAVNHSALWSNHDVTQVIFNHKKSWLILAHLEKPLPRRWSSYCCYESMHCSLTMYAGWVASGPGLFIWSIDLSL